MDAATLSMEHTFRFSAIYWLGTIMHHVDDARDLNSVISDFEYDVEDISRAMSVEFDQPEQLFQYIFNTNKCGFLAKFETPVMKKYGYSWSQYSAAWIYAETAEGLLEQAKSLAVQLQQNNGELL